MFFKCATSAADLDVVKSKQHDSVGSQLVVQLVYMYVEECLPLISSN